MMPHYNTFCQKKPRVSARGKSPPLERGGDAMFLSIPIPLCGGMLRQEMP